MNSQFYRTSQEQYDTDEMAKEFLYSFPNQMFTVDQQLAFAFKDKKLLILVVKEVEGCMCSVSIKLLHLLPFSC
jgi:hypothetical protein